MAGGIGSGYRSSGSHRVFVLVDDDAAKGVFFSWDDAEDFADAHGHSLEMLMEYETAGDHPDHLHLMAAKWESGWKFQGEWSQRTLNWQSPPTQVRLDHYHAKGDEFSLFRSWEFDWVPGLLSKVNPMAPDSALEKISPKRKDSEKDQSPAETFEEKKQEDPPEEKQSPYQDYETEFSQDAGEKSPEKKKSYFQDYDTDFESKKPDINFDDSDAMLSDKVDTSPSFPSPVRKLPKIVERAERLKDTLGTKGLPKKDKPPQKEEKEVEPEAEKPKSKLRLTPTPVPIEEKPEEESSETPVPPKSRIIKKSNLKLRKKAAPEPIPAFRATSTHGTLAAGKPDMEAEPVDSETGDETSRPVKKVWSAKLIFTVASVGVCWLAGLLWALIPEPSTESVVAEVATLNRARMVIVEPKMVFYQFPVDPVHQERYIQNLNLQPIPKDEPIAFPKFHTMNTWEQVGSYVRPPYAEVEVEEWWDLKNRDIQYGFYRQWEDGSILILDFESDSILGWAQAKYLKDILN